MGNKISAKTRMLVLKRDGFRCTYCGAPGSEVEIHVDHVIAKSKGGSNHISNLTTSCRICNESKGNKSMSPAKERQNGIIGMYIHLLENGKIKRQGIINALLNDMAIVQLFKFTDGYNSNVIAVPLLTILDDNKCAMYSERDDMLEAWDREHRWLLDDKKMAEWEKNHKPGDDYWSDKIYNLNTKTGELINLLGQKWEDVPG